MQHIDSPNPLCEGTMEARDLLVKSVEATNANFIKGGSTIPSASMLPQSLDEAHPDADECEVPAARPEDSVPDLPENAATREFLAKAPSRGLWMPLGVEVKVMQCWRCKAYGHRTGDRECPLSTTGNVLLDSERRVREDPMGSVIARNKRPHEDLDHLKSLVEDIRRERARKKEKRSLKRKLKHAKKHKQVWLSIFDSMPCKQLRLHRRKSTGPNTRRGGRVNMVIKRCVVRCCSFLAKWYLVLL